MVELAGGAMVRPVADGGVMTTYAMQVELTCPHCGHPGLRYQRHQRNGEHPVRCQPCRAAHARDAADRRATTTNQQPKEPSNT